MTLGAGPASELRTRLAAIGSVPYFARLGEPERRALADRLERRVHAKGEMLFSEGDTCPGIHLVESGQLKLYKTSDDGREHMLRLLEPGHHFGEAVVFAGSAYPVSVRALRDSVVHLLPRGQVEELLRSSPAFALEVVRYLSRVIEGLIRKVGDLTLKDVRRRLATVLLDWALERGRPAPAGVEVELPVSQEQLAALVGTVREQISRGLSRLEESGLLEVAPGGRLVWIRDLDRLRDLVDGTVADG